MPQTDAMKDVVNNLVSGGIILHEFQKYDFYSGKKEVKTYMARFYAFLVTKIDISTFR